MPYEANQLIFTRKLQVGLAFALSFAIGVFSAVLAKGNSADNIGESDWESSTLQTEFIEEALVDLVQVEPFHDVPLTVPIVPNPGPPTATASPTPILRRKSEWGRAPEQNFVIPELERELVEEEGKSSTGGSIIDIGMPLIPGNDLLSRMILAATESGIDVNDFAVHPFLESVEQKDKDQPLTIDQAVQMDAKGSLLVAKNPLRSSRIRRIHGASHPTTTNVSPSIGSRTPATDGRTPTRRESMLALDNLLKDIEKASPPPVTPEQIKAQLQDDPASIQTAVPPKSELTFKQGNAEPTTQATEVPPATPIAESIPEAEPVESVPPMQYQIPPEPNVVITRRMSTLQPQILKAIRFYQNKPLNTKDDSAWSIMHSILGYGPNGQVAINGRRGSRTNAVQWMCSNNLCMNRRLLYLDRGYIRGLEGPGFQGHPAQFLAMLAQINLRRDYPIHVQGYTLKVEDMVNSEMFTCSSRRELTFKLIALSHYLHSDAKWKNQNGETWGIPKILELELAQPVNGAACGGTHRVMSIAFAVRTKERRGEPLDGVYLRAKKYVQDYQRYTLTLQNRDGSFSSDWFKRRSDWGDKDRQLQTTGHMLEWMVFSLPRNELADPRIVRGVEFLTNLMTRNRFHDWEVGPRGHALRALSLYHQRVFERQPKSMPVARLGSLPVEISLVR